MTTSARQVSPAGTVLWGGALAVDVIAQAHALSSASDAHLLAAVDEALAGSGAVAELVCTHVDRSAAVPRAGVSLRLDGEPADPAATRAALARALSGPVVTGEQDGEQDGEESAPARTAVAEAAAGSAGRAVRFPGQTGVSGLVPVARLLAETAIDRVAGLGGAVADTDVVDTGDHGFLRPTWSGGELTLLVEPTVGGVLRPFEIEDPHECCGGAGH
ncbi:hypothetical protein KUM42_11915 [Modestobacter sp. L9-4]|uniref:hypothetical protein n=1 Tax=Modestobacter sp. L9-4 TaxID=2851567 RepID=UPI001C7607E6|nr:hypothetical protein [Modestobacter sp. L9-4]QXG74594.1 hypothetical protein KUM42_11915 [Modestobacter sp. L9-4]